LLRILGRFMVTSGTCSGTPVIEFDKTRIMRKQRIALIRFLYRFRVRYMIDVTYL
jgi:hypothetical protein